MHTARSGSLPDPIAVKGRERSFYSLTVTATLGGVSWAHWSRATARMNAARCDALESQDGNAVTPELEFAHSRKVVTLERGHVFVPAVVMSELVSHEGGELVGAQQVQALRGRQHYRPV